MIALLPFGESLTVLALFAGWGVLVVAAAGFFCRERNYQAEDR